MAFFVLAPTAAADGHRRSETARQVGVRCIPDDEPQLQNLIRLHLKPKLPRHVPDMHSRSVAQHQRPLEIRCAPLKTSNAKDKDTIMRLPMNTRVLTAFNKAVAGYIHSNDKNAVPVT